MTTETKVVYSLAVVLLKQRGHDAIDRMVELGTPRLRVYHKLSKRMGSRMLAHFSYVNDIPTLNKMVRHLDEMLMKKRISTGTDVPKGDKYDYKVMFTDKELLRQIGERNRAYLMPWWRKGWLRACAILGI